MFREEESQEEADARNALGLGVHDRQADKLPGQHAGLVPPDHMEVDGAQSSSLPSNPVVPEPGQVTPQPEPLPKAFVKSSNQIPTTLISAVPSADLIPETQAPPKASASRVELGSMVVTAPVDEDKDDEDMPGINMDSDSD
jgi:hypothetical protein